MLAAGTALRAQTLGGEYRLSRVFPVEGRQGIAADSNYYYVSGSTVLYKYDKQGRLVARNGQVAARREPYRRYRRMER